MYRKLCAAGGEQGADLGVFRGAFGGLGEDLQRLGKVYFACRQGFFQHEGTFHHQGVAAHLTQQAQHLGVTHPAENEHLSVTAVFVQTDIGLPDIALQLQHHGAGAVDDRQVTGRRPFIRGRRFAMGADEHRLPFRHFGQLIDGDQPLFPQAGKLFFVVHDGSQGIQPAAAGKDLFRARDGPDYSATEAGAGINLYV